MRTDRNEALIERWLAWTGPTYELPPPWFDAQCFGGYEFLPIPTHAELRDETLSMKQCVAAYAERISKGENCAVSVRQNGCRVATALLEPPSSVHKLVMLRGYRGAVLPEVEAVFREWLASGAAGQ